MTRSGGAAFVRRLADKIDAGEVVLRQGEEEVTLTVPSHMTLEVEDEDKGAKGTEHSLEIELTWFDDEQGGPLVIG